MILKDHINTIMIALIGGTIISVILGYLVAYWKDLGGRSSKSTKGKNWFENFDQSARRREQNLKYHQGKTHTSSSAEQKSSKKRKTYKTSSGTFENNGELERLLEKFEEESAQLFRYFKNLKECANDLFELEAKELSNKLKNYVNPKFMGKRMEELLELKAFDSFGKQGLGPEEVRNLWHSFTVTSLYMEDARFGSSTISKIVQSELHLTEGECYQLIEIQLMLIRGGGKNSIFKKYWKNGLGVDFERSEFLQQMTPDKRVELALRWAQAKGGLTAHEIQNQLFETHQSLEDAFVKFEKEKKKERGKKKQSSQGKDKTRSQTYSSKSDFPEWAFKLLEMEPNTDYKKIKKQYKKMAMKYHPDRLGQQELNDIELKQHHEHFVKIQEAYGFLEKRYSKKSA